MLKNDKYIMILGKIINYCDEIDLIVEKFGKSFESFEKNFIFQRSCSMCILQIGELASRTDDNFRNKYNKVPWIKICGMRNRFAHDYDNMLIKRIWETIEDDIPFLKEYCKSILNVVSANDSE